MPSKSYTRFAGPGPIAAEQSSGPVKVDLIVYQPPLWQQACVAFLRVLESALNKLATGLSRSTQRDVEKR